jgi:putative FmdB family regulatory protein
MPIYEFMCEVCNLRFEKLQNYDTENPQCIEEDCQGPTARLISAPSFVLKGRGWYKDGYTKNPSKTKTSD